MKFFDARERKSGELWKGNHFKQRSRKKENMFNY